MIGRGGAGKTTVALRLGRELGLPVIHLDRLYWGPGWQSVAPRVFRERQAAAIAGDAWVIDGGYLASAGWEARIERADLVVLVEAPLDGLSPADPATVTVAGRPGDDRTCPTGAMRPSASSSSGGPSDGVVATGRRSPGSNEPAPSCGLPPGSRAIINVNPIEGGDHARG